MKNAEIYLNTTIYNSTNEKTLVVFFMPQNNK